MLHRISSRLKEQRALQEYLDSIEYYELSDIGVLRAREDETTTKGDTENDTKQYSNTTD